MSVYVMIVKHSDDSVHRVEVPRSELADAITQIERKGSEIILIEKSAKSHAEDGMTNLKELHDDGLIKLTPVMVEADLARLVSVNCDDWNCGESDETCHGGCPNWDPHEVPLSEIPEEYREFFLEDLK
jgi:hypothetical protein